MASSILSTRYYDETTDEYKWFTHSTVNTHIFFCEDCGVEDHNSDGRCTECLKKEQLRDLAERFYLGECYSEHDEGYAAAKAWFLGELGEPPTLEQAYELGKKLLTWYDYSGEGEEHHCSGEFDYDNGCYACDDSDDPLCPQYVTKKEKPAKNACADCNKEFFGTFALTPDLCPPCAMDRNFPCQGPRWA